MFVVCFIIILTSIILGVVGNILNILGYKKDKDKMENAGKVLETISMLSMIFSCIGFILYMMIYIMIHGHPIQ